MLEGLQARFAAEAARLGERAKLLAEGGRLSRAQGEASSAAAAREAELQQLRGENELLRRGGGTSRYATMWELQLREQQ